MVSRCTGLSLQQYTLSHMTEIKSFQNHLHTQKNQVNNGMTRGVAQSGSAPVLGTGVASSNLVSSTL